jgi:hypothetical protein
MLRESGLPDLNSEQGTYLTTLPTWRFAFLDRAPDSQVSSIETHLTVREFNGVF